jgi:hypothetical protein
VHIAKVSNILEVLWKNNHLQMDDLVTFERNRLHVSHYGDHLALKVLTNRPENILLYDEKEGGDSFDKLANILKNDKIKLFIACTEDVKKYYSQFYPVATTVGTYTIFWVQENQLVTKRFPSFQTFPPQHLSQISFVEGVELVGFSFEYGNFPSGVTTYWLIRDTFNPLPKVQYRLVPFGHSAKITEFSEHKMINGLVRSVSMTDRTITDHQVMILSNRIRSGEYKIEVRLKSSNNITKENVSNWYPLGMITVITNKRDVLSRTMNGDFRDYKLAVKVLYSLF